VISRANSPISSSVHEAAFPALFGIRHVAFTSSPPRLCNRKRSQSQLELGRMARDDLL